MATKPGQEMTLSPIDSQTVSPSASWGRGGTLAVYTRWRLADALFVLATGADLNATLMCKTGGKKKMKWQKMHNDLTKRRRKLLKRTKGLLEMRNWEAASSVSRCFSPSQAVQQSTALQMKGRKRDFSSSRWSREGVFLHSSGVPIVRY